MVTASNGTATSAVIPQVIFIGDFNTGKTALINALLRKDILHDSRLESKALPTLVTASAANAPVYSALAADRSQVVAKTQEEFLAINQDIPDGNPYSALAVQYPGLPFSKLTLIDTAGTSTDTTQSMHLTDLKDTDKAILIMVTDIEYWSAKHTMDSIALHGEQFGDRLLVVANKADHLNAKEIQRITDKAAKRMEDYGIAPLPRFFALSARLESARYQPHNEYRNRNKAAVRNLCDAAFDQLRVALYEFEASHTQPEHSAHADHLFQTPLAASLINLKELSHDAV